MSDRMPQNDAEHMVLAQRIATVETAVDRIADAMERLVRLEERHAETRDGVVRAHDRIDTLTARCNEIEQSVVPLKWMRRVLAALVLGAAGLIGTHLMERWLR